MRGEAKFEVLPLLPSTAGLTGLLARTLHLRARQFFCNWLIGFIRRSCFTLMKDERRTREKMKSDKLTQPDVEDREGTLRNIRPLGRKFCFKKSTWPLHQSPLRSLSGKNPPCRLSSPKNLQKYVTETQKLEHL
jgi:hypothetical protein